MQVYLLLNPSVNDCTLCRACAGERYYVHVD